MKKQPALILAALSCVLTVLCFWQVTRLRAQLDQVEANLTNQLSYSMDSITSNVYSTLQQEASLLLASEWSYGKPDISAQTVPVTFSVTPKSVTPGVTTAALLCQGQTIPLTLQDGAFSATYTMDLFSTLEVPSVTFTEHGTQYSELLRWGTLTPRYDLIPEWTAQMMGTSLSRGAKEATLRLDGLDICCTRWSADWPMSIQSVSILEKRNGELCRQTDITAEVHPREGFREDSYLLWEQSSRFSIPYGGRYELFVDLVDQNGWHYQIPFACYELTQEGGGSWEDTGSQQASLYDSDGNLLFQGQSEE